MKLSVVVAVVVLLFLSGCGSSPQSLIVGKWEVENAPMKMTAEFRGDGTAELGMLGQKVQATYKLNGDELEWSMNGMTTKAKIKVTATQLELTDRANRTIIYKRR